MKLASDPKARSTFGCVATVLAVVLLLVSAEILLLGLSQGGMASRIDFPLIDFWELFQTLWQQNSWQATLLLVERPMLEAAQVDADGVSQWRIYFFLPTVIAHVLVSACLVVIWSRAGPRVVVLLSSMLAAALVITSVSYIKLAEHCSDATWLLDVMLRILQNPFYESALFWREIWFGMARLFLLAQWLMALAGGMFFLLIIRAQRRAALDVWRR